MKPAPPVTMYMGRFSFLGLGLVCGCSVRRNLEFRMRFTVEDPDSL
jgi:hypothetical protein